MAKESARIKSYRDLRVWQLSVDMVEHVYRVTANLPKSEIYGLTSQIQKAAVSVPSNLAEGHTRDSTKEYLYFLSVALGSIAELETQLIIAQRLGYFPANEMNSLLSEIDTVGKMLRAIQKTLRTKLQNPLPPAPSP